ncbi:PREDICTED: uncharacterized protein LOC106749645 [Dinoponera quadriceps]|uniref:Uncharacterized protein LOC106749645 n=1 Tax=Dinoponera quadriceps TaxID=609295 RepID=A0A6P3Y3H8_DINQU|nr:PREDICTED: uncharacterized protein LOC106749645 [Dinoponera quadriceps]
MQLSIHKEKKYICDQCLRYFYLKKLKTHAIVCQEMNNCAILLLSEDKWFSFDNYSRKERLPFVVYTDLECVLKKIARNTLEEKCILHTYQHHKLFSIRNYAHCSYDIILFVYRFRRDTNCVSRFVERLEVLALNKEYLIY